MLIRIQPLIPWNILNYVLSVTSCNPKIYFISTTIGMAPATMIWLYVAVNMKNMQELITGEREMSNVEMIGTIVGTIVLFILIRIMVTESKK